MPRPRLASHEPASRTERIAWLLAWASCIVSCGVCGVAAAATDAELAQRFRPYIKTSLDGTSDQEQYRQASWQWFVVNSSLKDRAGTVIVPAGSWSSVTDLESKGSDLTVDGTDAGFTLALSDAAMHGEDWADVAMGDGTYAHVERIGVKRTDAVSGVDDRLVNIDYTMLWTYNSARDPWIFEDVDHVGDMTFLVVLYDPSSDRIVRLTYPAHGCILQLYQLMPGQQVSLDTLAGQDLAGKSVATGAADVHIEQVNEDDETDGNCSKWGAFLSSDNTVYLAADPVTGRYDHPVVFVENGTHESFPNPAGRITNGGDHGGKGPSWLPARATLLPAFDGPADDPAMPFLHFNGKIGSDPATLVRHRTWCWPTLDSDPDIQAPCSYLAGRSTSVEIDGFSDMTPYRTWRQLAWPQPVAVAAAGDAYAVAGRRTGTGAITSPFGGLDVASTFTPKGWTLHLDAGAYTATTLDRPLTLTVQEGPATLIAP